MLKKHKQLIIGFLLGALLFGVIPVGAVIQEYVLTKSRVRLVIDGEEFANDDLPILYMEPGYNYLPAAAFRDICSKLDLWFEYVGEKNEIHIETKIKNDMVERKDDNMKIGVKEEYNIIVDDGIEYVLLREISEKLPKNYVFDALIDKSINFAYQNKVLIENMPYKIINNKTYVSYEYLVNNILPLIE